MKRAKRFTSSPFSIRSISFHALVHKTWRYICRWGLLRTWKKNIGSNIFFHTEHIVHIFTILHDFRILLPTQFSFTFYFCRNGYTLHIYITFYFLPLFTCILQKIRIDLAFRHDLEVGCSCCYVSMCPCYISPLSSRPLHHVHPRHSNNFH